MGEKYGNEFWKEYIIGKIKSILGSGLNMLNACVSFACKSMYKVDWWSRFMVYHKRSIMENNQYYMEHLAI